MNGCTALVGWKLTGKKLKYSGKKKTWRDATLSTKNSVFIDLRLNPGLRDAWPGN